ncbi:protein of unknown function [Mucilaginibacter lappiensis]|uniref:DUF1772 domain-containing protein n=1 Tax=Mucilaginibacter lappiensis TaxID=354630 RepID=A0ABR6PH19_9SPHI|nr:DUF1772 domain-containing protein [Mucilaginibacter lappiensis]MBB6108554.1 hypothetical protein [Mucilaginibacter lappiensis]SIQ33459.1 protein of unknown function [Mucilaginibacter lappiensis]
MYTEKIRLLQLLVVIIIASQGIFYFIGCAEAMKHLTVPVFADYRKALDSFIAGRLRVLYYIALALGITVLMLSRQQMNGLVFLCTLVATLCIVVDVLIALKGSIPINNRFNQYPAGGVSDWRGLQLTWVKLILIRGAFSFTALVALLISWLW